MLSQVQRRIRSHMLLYRLVLASRILLAVGFIPTGLVKLLGWPFSALDPSIPAGAIFQTLYEGGRYWQFLGAGQVVAGICLLIPTTATLGALIFLPIMLNIVMITIGYDFGATTLITIPMLLANLFLLAWDYDRLRGLVGASAGQSTNPRPFAQHRLTDLERKIYLTGTVAGLLLFSSLRNLLPGALNQETAFIFFLLIALVAALTAIGLGIIYWQAERTRRESSADGKRPLRSSPDL